MKFRLLILLAVLTISIPVNAFVELPYVRTAKKSFEVVLNYGTQDFNLGESSVIMGQYGVNYNYNNIGYGFYSYPIPIGATVVSYTAHNFYWNIMEDAQLWFINLDTQCILTNTC